MPNSLSLPARMDLSSVPLLMTDLNSKAQSGDLTLDAANVTHFGALGLQAVLSTKMACEKNGHKLSLINVPDRALEQLQTMGMSPETIAENKE